MRDSIQQKSSQKNAGPSGLRGWGGLFWKAKTRLKVD